MFLVNFVSSSLQVLPIIRQAVFKYFQNKELYHKYSSLSDSVFPSLKIPLILVREITAARSTFQKYPVYEILSFLVV